MNLFRWVLVNMSVLVCLCCIPVMHAGAANIPVYKGELSIVIPAQRDALWLTYRTKTREVIRIGVRDIVMTNTVSGKKTRLDDRSASLANHHEAGYWNTEIIYNELKLDDDNYRVEGRITLYFIGSQQWRNFRVYLKPEAGSKPYDSSIDWGMSTPPE